MDKQRNGPKILIADDEPEMIDLVRLILEFEGYTVISARDGMEALNRIRDEQPALILIDVRMPRMGGLDVLEAMARAETTSIPVIVLSAATTYPDVRTALENGAIAYLRKPFELKEMTRLVAHSLALDAAGRDELRRQALEKLGR